MNTGMVPFERLAARAKERADKRLQQQKLTELVALIDELSGEMGSADFRDAIRKHGYDVDACAFTIAGRGIEYKN